jgi:hypothetical protein
MRESTRCWSEKCLVSSRTLVIIRTRSAVFAIPLVLYFNLQGICWHPASSLRKLEHLQSIESCGIAIPVN